YSEYKGEAGIYRIWIPSKQRCIWTKDVSFNETKFYDPSDKDLSSQLISELEHNIETIEIPEMNGEIEPIDPVTYLEEEIEDTIVLARPNERSKDLHTIVLARPTTRAKDLDKLQPAQVKLITPEPSMEPESPRQPEHTSDVSVPVPEDLSQAPPEVEIRSPVTTQPQRQQRRQRNEGIDEANIIQTGPRVRSRKDYSSFATQTLCH
ncbi:hypothetical protein V1525DRAFT_422970, partial [Lipomyces kononenkoae]